MSVRTIRDSRVGACMRHPRILNTTSLAPWNNISAQPLIACYFEVLYGRSYRATALNRQPVDGFSVPEAFPRQIQFKFNAVLSTLPTPCLGVVNK